MTAWQGAIVVVVSVNPGQIKGDHGNIIDYKWSKEAPVPDCDLTVRPPLRARLESSRHSLYSLTAFDEFLLIFYLRRKYDL